MSRNEQGLMKAQTMIQELREEFWENVIVPGSNEEFNQSLERDGRVADFLEFGELMVVDALTRKESCGCHFNEAFQTEENEAKRNDENFSYVATWKFTGEGKEPVLNKEQLTFENVELTQRSYK
jgi:succinate dehydrogenase / fumarate reductase flavoprotein subunit